MRLHKITVQPTWWILLPQMMSFIEENNPDMYQDLNSLMTCRSQVNPNHISEVFLAPNHHIRHTRFKRYPWWILWNENARQKLQLFLDIYANGWYTVGIHLSWSTWQLAPTCEFIHQNAWTLWMLCQPMVSICYLIFCLILILLILFWCLFCCIC